MAGGALGNVQARIAELRTRVQQQTATLRSRFRRPGMQIGWKDGNPVGPLGLGGPGGGAGGSAGLELFGGGTIASKVEGIRKRILPGSGIEGLETLPIVTTIRSKGIIGAITSRGMMQAITAGGFRPALTTKPPSPQTPPATGPAGYRKFV